MGWLSWEAVGVEEGGGAEADLKLGFRWLCGTR